MTRPRPLALLALSLLAADKPAPPAEKPIDVAEIYKTNDDYVAKQGKQISSIKAMLDTLTANAATATNTTSAGGTVPTSLVVTDTSDTAAALAWAPVAGAEGYRVARADAGGAFAAAGTVTGPSFGDGGLTPRSSYRWRVTAVIDKMIKQRKDSVSQFQAAGRDDLVAKENAELAVLSAYMPEQLSADAIATEVQAAVAATGAAGPQDMGKVMGVLKPKLAGKADMTAVSAQVKAALAK